MKKTDIFSIPIGFFNYEDGLTMENLLFLSNQKRVVNETNYMSEDTYILNQNCLYDLKKFIEKCVKEYLDTIYSPEDDVGLRITQSWLNWNETGQSHQQHYHTNSFISGCFYVNANQKTDTITFINTNYRPISFKPKKYTIYNSDVWCFPVHTNRLIIFPSYLTHNVQPVEGPETRISLSFNTFPTGCLGYERELTELNLI